MFEWIDPYLPVSEHADAHGGLLATMPGRVLAVHVKAGDEVAKGAPLVVLEAMKMEQTITAPPPARSIGCCAHRAIRCAKARSCWRSKINKKGTR